jgi:hypothetical protein
MSTAFTSPADQTWQKLLAGDSPYLDEITLAYSERRQAIGQDEYEALDGRDVQAVAYWTALQNWLETNCVSFIDHDNGPFTDAGDAFLFFTLDNWRATAGIPVGGFRRATEWNGVIDPTWKYGQMQEGDVIGPWIFEDLQKGFGALEKTLTVPYGCEYIYKGTSGTGYADFEAAKSAAAAFYFSEPVSGPISKPGYIIFIAGTRIGYYSGFYSVINSNYRCKIIIKSVPNFIPRSVKVYFLTTKWNSTGTGESVFDAAGMPEVEEDKLSLCGEMAANTDEDIISSDYYGLSFSELPPQASKPNDGYENARGYFTTSPSSEPPTRGLITAERCGAEITWDFTNA